MRLYVGGLVEACRSSVKALPVLFWAEPFMKVFLVLLFVPGLPLQIVFVFIVFQSKEKMNQNFRKRCLGLIF